VGDRYVAFLRRRFALVLAGAAAFVAVASAIASRLELRAGLEELLPTSDPRVAALDEMERRMGQFSSLVVLIRSPDPAARVAFAEALQKRLSREPLIERALFRVGELQSLVEKNRFLYADEHALQDALERLRFERARAKNPALVAIDEPPSLDEIEKRAARRRDAVDRLPGGLLARDDFVALVVLPARDLTSAADERIERAVRRAVDELSPKAGVTVQLAGAIDGAVRERRAIEEDVALTTAIVSALVALVVGLCFGRLRAIVLMVVPPACGVAGAMALAALAFGGLNSSTAFLIAIIVGNGINYPILTMARYAEERASAAAPAEALRRAIAATAGPTALAAFAAAAAYGSLALTRFRGFSQFGAIGAVGMALSWAATMTVLPSLLWWLDRKRPASAERVRRLDLGRLFAFADRRAPLAIAVAGVALTVAAALALPHWLRDPFEYDFSRLRTARAEDRADDRDLDALFGRALSPQVVLAPSREAARSAAAQLRARAAEPRSPIARVVTLDDLLPGSLDEQRRKLALLDQIRRLLDDPALDALSTEKKAKLARFRPPDGLRPLDERDLPDLALRPFRERDGALGRVVLVYPPQAGFSIADGRDLLRLAAALDGVVAGGRRLQAAGRAIVFAAMVESIAHDAPIATFASFAAVALLTFVLLRGRAGALVILGALAVGVLWMLGVAALLDVKLNFLNFIALPITFGIGVDYAANVWLRFRADKSPDRSIVRAVSSTGGAVALNSLTTIIGYGSLLAAHNLALRSFGAVAILGELACLAAALLFVPALVLLRHRRARYIEYSYRR